jgi:hypothetical protein
MTRDARIFHVQTPYQALQALALASEGQGARTLVMVPSHPSQSLILDALTSAAGSPFDTVHRLDAERPSIPLPSSTARRISAAVNVRRLSRLVQNADGPVEVFTGNAQTVEGQALVAAAARRRDGATAAVIEDGLLTYEKRAQPLAPAGLGARAASLVRRVYLGPGASRPAGQLPYDLLDAVYVSVPDALRSEDWFGLPVRAIPPPAAVAGVLDALASAIVPADEVARCRTLDALVVLPHSSLLSGAEAVSAFSRLVEVLADRGLRVGLKYHPRDDQRYLAHLSRGEIVTMRPDIAVEFLFVLAGSALQWIVTDRTTAVVSGPRYCPAARTITFSAGGSAELQATYQRLVAATGGTLVESPAEALELVAGSV